MIERDVFLLKMELKEFFNHRRAFHFVPLLLVGVFTIVWIYPVASPFVPIIVLVIAGLELQFNNIFYRTPKELEALCLFPLSWQRIILIKNIAAIILVVALLIVTSMALLYFSPQQVTMDDVLQAWLYVCTVLFPLLSMGNTQSVRRPRRQSGLQTSDLVEAIWLVIDLAILSLPFYMFSSVLALPVLSLLYGAGSATYWYRASIPKTSSRVEQEHTALCSSL